MVGDEKSSAIGIGMASNRDRDRDSREPRNRELLISVANSGAGDDEDLSSKPSSSSSSSSFHHLSGRETFYKVFRSWASKKFITGCVLLFPIAINSLHHLVVYSFFGLLLFSNICSARNQHFCAEEHSSAKFIHKDVGRTPSIFEQHQSQKSFGH